MQKYLRNAKIEVRLGRPDRSELVNDVQRKCLSLR